MLSACICALLLLVVAARVTKKQPPLDRIELERLRRISDQMRRDSILPFD
ncbi:MAG TPA: hypothetical protein VG672_09190 [Bryobacteraceae bacterium]|nr:hypothetical protein [Bryobacteraceae bacterium]